MHFLTPCRNYAAGVVVWTSSPGGASGGLIPCQGALYKAALLLFSTLLMALHFNSGTFQVHFPGVQGQLLTPAMPKSLQEAETVQVRVCQTGVYGAFACCLTTLNGFSHHVL